MRPPGASQHSGAPMHSNFAMQPNGTIMQMPFGLAHGSMQPQLAQGGQLGLGLVSHAGLLMSMPGQQQQLPVDVASGPWANGSSAQVPAVMALQQQAHALQQQPQAQHLSRRQRKHLRKQELQQAQHTQLYPSASNMQQPPQQFAASTALSAAEAHRLQATAAQQPQYPSHMSHDGQAPPWQQQQQRQQQQSSLQGPASQQQKQQQQQPYPAASQPLAAVGRGHDHIPVLQLGHLAASDATTALVLDRIDAQLDRGQSRTPPLHGLPDSSSLPGSAAGTGPVALQAAAAAPARALHPASQAAAAVPGPPQQEPAQQQMQAQGPPAPPAAPSQKQQQPLKQQQQQQQRISIVLGSQGESAKRSGAMLPPVAHLLQSASGNLQVRTGILCVLCGRCIVHMHVVFPTCLRGSVGAGVSSVLPSWSGFAVLIVKLA